MEKGKQTYKLLEGRSFATIDEIIDYSTGIFKDGDWIESKDQDAARSSVTLRRMY